MADRLLIFRRQAVTRIECMILSFAVDDRTRPYAGRIRLIALAVAKSLVSDQVPKYIGVQPYVVHEKQLSRAWKDIFFEALPEELGEK